MHIHGNRRQECVCDIAGGRRSWDPWDHWILVFLFNTRYSSCVVLHACLPSAQLCNFLLEFFGQQNFVRKAGVHEIEVIMDLAFFQSFGLSIIKVSWPFSHACQRSSSGTFDNPSQIFSKSARSVFARFSKGVAPTWSRMTIKIKVFSFLNETNLLSHKLKCGHHKCITCPFWFWNNCRLTSNTVLSNPMFAPWYKPTWCSHMFRMITSLVAMEKRADLRSKSWSSPLSRPSVPSTSITNTCMPRPRDIQMPFVVWLRWFSSMTSKFVPKSRFNRVPDNQPLRSVPSPFSMRNKNTYSFLYFAIQRRLQRCTGIPHRKATIFPCSLASLRCVVEAVSGAMRVVQTPIVHIRKVLVFVYNLQSRNRIHVFIPGLYSVGDNAGVWSAVRLGFVFHCALRASCRCISK